MLFIEKIVKPSSMGVSWVHEELLVGEMGGAGAEASGESGENAGLRAQQGRVLRVRQRLLRLLGRVALLLDEVAREVRRVRLPEQHFGKNLLMCF